MAGGERERSLAAYIQSRVFLAAKLESSCCAQHNQHACRCVSDTSSWSTYYSIKYVRAYAPTQTDTASPFRHSRFSPAPTELLAPAGKQHAGPAVVHHSRSIGRSHCLGSHHCAAAHRRARNRRREERGCRRRRGTVVADHGTPIGVAWLCACERCNSRGRQSRLR